MPLEGQHLGHYRLLRLLGSGGMGEVYLAEDVRIGQQVAIKVIRSEGIAYPQSESAKEAARLFEREAKAIARLDHPNILPLYAYGEEMLNDTLLTYLVMPYRKEGTLASWLRQRSSASPLSPAEVAPLFQQAAAALQHAHHQHVLHQDIKPTNFLIRLRSDQPEQPDLLLADFGIAKLMSATASASQSIRGTPTYMAPEQWDGHPVAASDQYALAIMVYELLVGRPPFVGNSGQVMRQHYLVHPPAPSSLSGRLSPAIDAVLLRALAKQPEERFASVTAFAQAFQEAMHSDGELHATLAISRAEAESGTTRTLTLPGGRQVSVTVAAGVGDGTTLRLEGQGMPYYEGGPAGPLVLKIAIPAQASSLPLPPESTEPTVAVSLPNAEPPSVEEPSVPPARPEAPGHLEPTVPASHASGSAPTVLATNTTSLPTELDIAAPIVQGNWWILALRGLFAVIFGLIALLFPGTALLAFIYVFAAYALVDGGVAVITAIQERGLLHRWKWILFEGILSILAGIIAFANPSLTALVLLYIIAAWAIVTGVMEIAAAFAIREFFSREWVLALAGIASVAFGILLFIHPRAGILSILWLVGIYGIVFGLLFIVRAFQLRSWALSVTI